MAKPRNKLIVAIVCFCLLCINLESKAADEVKLTEAKKPVSQSPLPNQAPSDDEDDDDEDWDDAEDWDDDEDWDEEEDWE